VRADRAERQYLEAREEIALETANRFMDVYAAQVALENAAANAAANDTLYRLNQGRFEVGKIGENELLQSELVLLRARTSLDAARLTADRALAALRLALGLPASVPLDIAVPDAVPVFEADTAVAVAEALRNRAAMADVSLQDVQARRRVREAKLTNGLNATIQASYGFNATGPEMGVAYRDLLEARRFQVSVEIPLWQWGARSGNIRAAEAEREQAEHSAHAVVEQTAHEARFAALGISQARRGLELSARGDTVAQKRFEVAYNRYLIGRISLENLFTAQNEKDQARNQFVQALRNYWQAYYTLRRVTLFDFERGARIG
jgi:outer membrane protein TolC